MIIIKQIKSMSRWAKTQKNKGRTIGFVPTMGYIHEGHLSLVRKAKKDCDRVVMSIFVNPIQFGPKEDFKRYPRDSKRDYRLAKSAGVDLIFYPSTKDMYPDNFLTYVSVTGLTNILCGRSRPDHFKGVTTVVTKLFNIIAPDIAYFGQKDAQQAIVIKKMAEDLNFPIKISVLPTVREGGGLAMSSRNTYLSASERYDALVINRALKSAKRLISSGELNAYMVISHIKKLIKQKKSVRIDYVEVVDMNSLKKINKISGGVLIVIAVFIGKTRLIDNITLKI
jgi:pantoate--beta-alanine ligase